ncbi:MAG: FG-GAP-like repeat-containing protein [Acidobacteriota bacterium]
MRLRPLTGILLMIAAASASSRMAAVDPLPSPAPPGVPAAMRKLQGGDAAGAAKILEGVVAREPRNAPAWRGLGTASLRLKNLDRAEEAFRKTLEIEPGSPRAMYNLGAVAGRRENADSAFEWLKKARATGKIDMTYAQVDPDLAALRQDPRFPSILPSPADFERPFVESVKVLREWDGEAANDQFGWIARNIGDVDGDGVNDIVTSAPTKEIGGAASAGRIYVYSTKSGKLLWSADGRPGEELGTGVESAGDTNRDGIPDVIAGAPGGGKAYLYSGRDGRVLRTFTAESADVDFGRHVSAAGDVDGDGFADVLVGSPGKQGDAKAVGRAYLYSGKDGRALLALKGERPGDEFGSTVGGSTAGKKRFLIVGASSAGPRQTGRTYVYEGATSKPKFVIDSDDTGAALGAMFVSVAGDVNGDGVPDVYASDFSNSAKGPSTGRVYVHSGRDGSRLLTLTGETAGEGFGIGPATAGDVDGDGRADLIVGAWQYSGAAVSGGRAYLFSGKDGRLIKTFTCRTPGDTFGFDAVGLGDVDGDGTIDFLISSAWSGIHGYHSGRMFLLSSGVQKKTGQANGRKMFRTTAGMPSP